MRNILTKMLEGLPHAQALGMRAEDIATDRVTLSAPYAEHLIGDPATGVIHGGVVTALLDTACGMAAVSNGAVGSVATLDLRIDYMRPAKPRRAIFARAECYRRTRVIAFLRGVAWDEAEDDPVASAAGAFMIERVKA